MSVAASESAPLLPRAASNAGHSKRAWGCVTATTSKILLTFISAVCVATIPTILLTVFHTATGEPASKWVVVTSIQYPTSDVKKMCAQAAQDPDLEMVVVADLKTPVDWKAEGCTYLSVEAQKKLGFKTADVLPYKNYARKNIGYLYAISKGAKHIYETDDDNLSDLARVFAGTVDDVCGATLENDGVHDAQNVYSYFGRPDVWPRGFPLENINNTDGNNVLTKKSRMTKSYSPIKSYLVNGDPDTDAIFRLTHGEAIGKVKLDAEVPPVVLDHGVMCPFNSQAVLWSRDAFWLMLIPATTPMRVCDIWRGYFAQRLLWEIGGKLLFDQEDVWQIRTSHNYLDDFKDELELYSDARRLMDLLLAWKPDPKTSLDKRFIELCGVVAASGFWSERKFCEAWIHDLRALGYEFPSPVDPRNSKRPALGEGEEEEKKSCSSEAQLALREWRKARDDAAVLSKAVSSTTGPPRTNTRRIDLFLMFNSMFEGVGALKRKLRELYTPYFRSVNFIGLDEACNTKPNGESREGYNMMSCFANGVRALNSTDSDGFLMIPNDAILLPWKLHLPPNEVWSLSYKFASAEWMPPDSDPRTLGCPDGFVREPVPLELWPREAVSRDLPSSPPLDALNWDENTHYSTYPGSGRTSYLSPALSPRRAPITSAALDRIVGGHRPFNCIPPKAIADALYVPRAVVDMFMKVTNELTTVEPPIFCETWVASLITILVNELAPPGSVKRTAADASILDDLKWNTIPNFFDWSSQRQGSSAASRALAAASDEAVTTALFHPIKFGSDDEILNRNVQRLWEVFYAREERTRAR